MEKNLPKTFYNLHGDAFEDEIFFVSFHPLTEALDEKNSGTDLTLSQ